MKIWRRKRVNRTQLAFRRGGRPRSLVRQAIVTVLAAVEVIAIIYILLFWPVFTVERVIVSDMRNQRLGEDVERFILERANGVFHGRMFFFPANQTERRLKNRYGEISEIKIYHRWPDAVLEVKVTERPLAVEWLRGEERWVLDHQGVAVEVRNERTEGIPLVEDQREGSEISAGREIVRPEVVGRIIKFDAELKSLGLPAERYLITETPFQITATGGIGYQIIFDTKDPVEGQIAVLKRTLTYFKDNNLTPKEYVNLTIRNRVYWK